MDYYNKVDLSPARAQLKDQKREYAISALTGQGLELLVADLAALPATPSAPQSLRWSPASAIVLHLRRRRTRWAVRWRLAAPARRS